MPNVNYIGSLAQRKMQFASSVTVQSLKKSDLFNAISIYVPLSLASANIADGLDLSKVNADTPGIIAVTVDNYATELKGDLLSQWTPVFRGDSNFSVTLFIIIFDDTQAGSWAIGTKTIDYAPLTKAFQMLYFVSYFKTLFDPAYNGEDVVIPGRKASGVFTFANGGTVSRTLTAGTYTFSDGTKSWELVIAADHDVPAGGSLTGVAGLATTVGPATLAQGGTVSTASITPSVNADFTVTATTIVQGANAVTQTSRYFDLALAFSGLASINVKLTAAMLIARVDLTKITNTADTNKCWIRSKTAAQEEAAVTSLSTADRAKYFWGCLKFAGATNTFVCADVENRNLVAVIFSEWFAAKNASGEYVGNKLSLLRITGQKCFGLPSPINGIYNQNDVDGFKIFDEKNVGYLSSISASADGDSCLSACLGVNGFPINAYLISKYVDYKSSQDCADMITDKGTLTNPVLTDEQAYMRIQNIVAANLKLFVPTQRVTNVAMNFPAFSAAKNGLTAIEAASAWTAGYVDDLSEVKVSGGITQS